MDEINKDEKIRELEKENLQLKFTIRNLKNQLYQHTKRTTRMTHDEHEYNVNTGEDYDR